MLMHSASCISTVTSIALSMMTFKVIDSFASLHSYDGGKPEKSVLTDV